jgi:predicted nuclease of restriction endonuclease-like RecB superfamily
LLPTKLLRCCRRGDRLTPPFLGPADLPWIRALLAEADRFVGRPERELEARLRLPFEVGVPALKLQPTIHVLRGLHGHQPGPGIRPARARAAVFTAAAGDARPRAELLTSVAAELGLSAIDLEAALHADMPGERLVGAPPGPISPVDLVAIVNLSLAQSMVARARSVTIELLEASHRVVRVAKLRGLLCVVSTAANGRTRLDLSGPLALFHHTVLYGRALASLLPVLTWCLAFELRASCIIDGQALRLELSERDGLRAAAEPQRHDSQLERHFERDFARAAPGWQVLREPTALAVHERLIFPDFALVGPDGRRWLLEIVGFWTPDYLTRKLADYRAAGCRDLILCIDARLGAQPTEVPAKARVVIFRRRIEVAQVLALLRDEKSGSHRPEPELS